MQITIIAVNVEKKAPAPGKKQGYEMLTVTYRDERGVKEKKLMSFASPAVFKVLSTAQPNDVYDVTSVKNEASGYYDWTAANKSDGSVASAPTSQAGSNKAATTSAPGRSNFETPEERALRQRLIVRQSSLAQAIEFSTAGHAVDDLNEEQVLDLAERFHDWVYKQPDIFTQENDIDKDIPF